MRNTSPPCQTKEEPKIAFFWSARYEGNNGQAIVTRQVAERQSGTVWIKTLYRPGSWKGVTSVAAAAARLWLGLATGRSRTLYLVCSRSTTGFLRDLPALAASVVGARVIVHCHGSDLTDLLSRGPLSGLARGLYRRCEIVVPSRHLLEPLAHFAPAAVHLCENFVPEAPPSDSTDSEAVDLLWNSNVMSSKGFFDLAEAVRRVRADGVPLHILALGAPMADREMSEAEVRRRLAWLQVEPWFTWLGPVSPGRATELVSRARMVALPSRYSSECQPLAVAQAMCEGKVLIVSDTPAMRATVQDYPAIIVPESTVHALTQALKDAAERPPAKALRDAAASLARTRFSRESFDRRISAVLWPPQVSQGTVP